MADKFFGLYENALSDEFCDRLINRFENDPRKARGLVGDGSKYGSFRKDIKDTTEIIFDNSCADWKPELDIIVDSLKHNLAIYIKPWAASIKVQIYPEVFKLARYDPGGIFDWHSDNIGGALTRVITAIWYLNTVKEGGETHYPWQDMKISPKKGTLLFCPVGWPYFHKAEAPISESKYIMITQLHQKV